MSTATATIAPTQILTRKPARTRGPSLFDVLKHYLSRELLAAAEPGNLSVSEIGHVIGRDQVTVSVAMRPLVMNDLVLGQRRGKQVFYRLTEKGRRVLAWVAKGEELGGNER